MKSMFISVILLSGVVACEKSRFASDTAASQSYDVNVTAGAADANPADGTIQVETDIKNSSGDSGSMNPSSDADAVNSGTNPLDPSEATTDNKTDAGSSQSQGQKGNGKGSGKTNGNEGKSDEAECASVAGVGQNRVKVAGSQKDISLTPTEALAIRLTGNLNKVTLKLSATLPTTKLPAVCIFVAGNQNKISMDVNMVVGKIYVRARGNQALVEAQVNKDGVIEDLQIDANGHSPQIVMKGEGKYPCDKNIESLSCQ